MNSIVTFALKQRMLVIIFMLLLFGAGFVCFTRLNIEAYPDPVPPSVEVITQSSGQSAEEIERYMTIPIEIQMAGIPHVRSVRTISLFGLSDVRVEFTYDYTYDEAEQRVINRLSQLSPRSAVIVAATIPFALFFAVIIMTLRGESANLLSVGAIDFGLIVDATVIMMENIYRHLAQKPEQRFAYSAIQRRIGAPFELRGKLAVIANSALEVNRAIFFSAAIIIAGFIPLFTLSGVEGHIFGPMAKTYAYAIAGGLIAAFTITPALSALLLPDQVKETETVIVRGLRKIYTPVLKFTLANRIVTLGGAAVLVISAAVAARSLGLEFLPKLEEGNLWIRASLPPTISLEEAQGYADRIRKIIRSFPEVQTVISQLGRPDDGTDTTGFFNLEFNVPLKPFATWPPNVDKEKLTRQINAALEWPFPGIDFNFSQYIEDNVEEAASGVKGQNSIKLFGNDLEALQNTAYQIKAVLETVPGMTDLSVFDAFGQPTVDIDIDRTLAARYALSPGDINSTVQAAIGGQAAGNLYEYGSDRNFPIVIRLAQQYRQSLDAMRHIPIGAPNPNGSGIVPIPLSDNP